MIAFGTQFFGVAVAALFAVAALHYTYLAPMYAMAQGVAMVRMRTTSVALMLFVVNLVGYGVGPPLVGAISDWFTGAHLAAMGLPSSYCRLAATPGCTLAAGLDRKSTRLNSSH